MTTVSGGVKGLVARAQREAQRRAQSPSTAYLLLVMLQTGGPMGKLLSELGVKESDLLSAIRVVDTEPTSALERAVERAYRLAKSTGAAQVLPAHLLARDRARQSKRRTSKPRSDRSRFEACAGGGPERASAGGCARRAKLRRTSGRPRRSSPPPAKPARPSARRTAEPAPLIELRVEKPDTTDETLDRAACRSAGRMEDEIIVPSSSPFALDAGSTRRLPSSGAT